ncbi:hypothetical protein CLTEP_04850 [Clostridium tepidiprofundi DSM 19306]|uniref:DUF2500 domain-containing protein n=1 Tax=Clostridium tepidiprofundi DSM 19306 TaxID=1121338 RepID=A0A151B6L6_9CLOT|nr:DUF2500 domain-containing protein [Clostridium tepidiprofundi]KYH35546.1 hypothetical protein CLTEP_04850 [Clostridium tepidiprofundi DSM 19306]
MRFFMGGFPPIFMIFFAIILGVIIFSIIATAKNYYRNATSPILSEHARIVSKRTEVIRNSSMSGDNHTHNSSRTRYYVTFETDAGQRIELILSGKEYGLLAEGDIGLLTYQGEWYKKFEREIFR